MGGFSRFRDREDKGMFPDSGKVSVGNREVEEGGEIGDSKGAKVFKVKVSEAVRTKRRGAFGRRDCLGHRRLRERHVGMVQFPRADFANDDAGAAGLTAGERGDVLFI